MPYSINKDNCVCGPDGEPIKGGCHDNMEDAKKHLAALEANVPDAKESAKPRTGYFAELVELSEAKLNEGGDIARVTLIKPGWSANGRYYSKDVLKSAAPLFEGGQAYADHPGKSEKKERPERSIRDLVGYYEGVSVEKDGRVTGNLHIVQDWLKPIVRASVTDNKNLAGLSINALGETRMGEIDGKKGIIVEAIVKHNSTDVVTTPAAGGRFDSLLASDGDSWTKDLLEAMPLDELMETLRDTRPDLIKAYQKEWKTPRDEKAVSAVRAEADSLKAKLAESEKKYRAVNKMVKSQQADITRLGRVIMVDRLLSESKLPKEWRDDLRAQLMEAKDNAAMVALLDREAAKAGKRASARPLTVKGSGQAVAPSLGSARMRAGNPVASVFGVDARLAEAKTLEEFNQMKSSLMEA